MTEFRAQLLELLVYVQANLGEDLSLRALARHAGWSASHVHRTFKQTLGETPRGYVERLRLDRAAFRLLIQDCSLLAVALECGFHHHETFTRAFRRRFGTTPAAYREKTQQQARRLASPADALTIAPQTPAALSSTQVVRLRDIHVAFIRHVGRYEDVPEALFARLHQWAVRARLPEPFHFVGIGHDAPGITAPENLRFDAGLILPERCSPEGLIGYQCVPGGNFAVTTHAGPLDTLPQAYAQIIPRAMTLAGYQLVGLPALELYHTHEVMPSLRIEHTDICLPVTRRQGAATTNR